MIDILELLIYEIYEKILVINEHGKKYKYLDIKDSRAGTYGIPWYTMVYV